MLKFATQFLPCTEAFDAACHAGFRNAEFTKPVVSEADQPYQNLDDLWRDVGMFETGLRSKRCELLSAPVAGIGEFTRARSASAERVEPGLAPEFA